MSTGIPIPNILERSTAFMLLQFINDPTILGYRIRVANSLDNAYGAFNGVPGVGTTSLPGLDANRGTSRITRPIRIKGTGISGEITRGQTRITFDPNPFFGDSPEVPADSDLWFLRTQVRTTASPTFPGGAADNTNQSDILIVQGPGFFNVPRPALSLYGTAPALGGAVPGFPAPEGAMIFHVPAFADAMVVTNHDASDPLFFAVGARLPLMQVDPATSISHSSGMKDEIVLCAAPGGNPDFSILVSIVTGER